MKKLLTLTMAALVSLVGISSTVSADTVVSNSGTFTEPGGKLEFCFPTARQCCWQHRHDRLVLAFDQWLGEFQFRF